MADLKSFHAALGAAGLRNQKEAVLSGYGVDSSRDLTQAQLNELTDRLNQIARTREREKGTDALNASQATTRKKRSIVMALLAKLGVYIDNESWQRVNAFLLQKKIAGKVLYEMSDTELDTLARKLRSMLAKKVVATVKEDNTARWN